jgi:6,7-dimethyl-8-ribityllumazine synthase
MATIEGKLSAQNLKATIIVSRFNALVTKELLGGAIDCFVRHGGKETDLTIIWVPGAFEIPQVTQYVAAKSKTGAIITLGAVIRGDTPHFDQVVNAVTKGVAEVALHASIPVVFGVLTTDNLEQALERAGSKAGNKGWDAMQCALEMASVLEKLA